MKLMTLAFALCALVGGTAHDKSYKMGSFEALVGNRLLVPGESVPAFTDRIRQEIACENLRAKLVEYREARSSLEDDINQSYGYISKSLDQWDAELYRISGHVFRYTGALGQYARKVDDYATGLRTNLTKLQIFLTTYDAKLGECGQH